MTARRGELLDERYRLEQPIGEGGMGEVWAGTDLQLGRRVAIKLLHAHITSRPDAVARFEREARVGAALGHPNVVHTLDFGDHQGRRFLVMQLVSSVNLLDYRLAHGPLMPARIVAFGYQVAGALAAAHQIGLVHRDLKAENVLVEIVGADTILRVADFGMAYLVAPDDARQGRLTMDGQLGGTPEYMAPEMIAGGIAEPPADIYALGCLLFELACEATPFPARSVGKIFAGHLYLPPPKIRAIRPDISTGFEELVQRMLAKLPAERPTADAVVRRLATLDPEELDASTRGRRATVVSDRASRMVTASPPIVTVAEPAPGRVHVVGALDAAAVTALAVAGLVVTDAAPHDVRVLLDGTLEDVALICADDVPVVADADRNDFRRISDLLRLGVAEVVFKPIAPASLVQKVARAIRKRAEPLS